MKFVRHEVKTHGPQVVARYVCEIGRCYARVFWLVYVAMEFWWVARALLIGF